MKRTLQSVFLLAVTAVMVVQLNAQPVTYSFTGTQTYHSGNFQIGDTISGTATMNVGATPDFLEPDAYWYGGGQYAFWYDGAFAINAITNTGYTTGTAEGGGQTRAYDYDLPHHPQGPYTSDGLYWEILNDTMFREIQIYDYDYRTAGDGLATVADPWTPLAAQYHFLFIYDYNYYTGEYSYTEYSLDSFTPTTQAGDTTPPIFSSLTPSVATLSPPNHQMVPVTLTAVTSDNVGVVSTKIVSATSSEPDNGLGDGDTANDIQITGDLAVSLRAERSGKGNGRTYTITVEAADAAGNKTQKTTTVSVPKSQSAKK